MYVKKNLIDLYKNIMDILKKKISYELQNQ